MNKELKNKTIKHAVSVLVLALITLVYFNPLLDGKDISQSDMMFFEGMSKELKDYQKETGEYSYWTNSMFSGGTAIFLYDPPELNVYNWMGKPIKLLTPYMSFAITFMMLLCFYLCIVLLGFEIWIALGAALMYAFCSYNMIIIEAGHITKAYAIAMIPLVMGGAVLAYQKNIKAGAVLFMIGLGLLIAQNHLQITYYTGLMVGIYVLILFIYSLIKKTFPDFLKRSSVLLLAIVLAILPSAYLLYTSYDYSKESLRGKSELVGKESTGLSYDYAFAWSYGVKETFSLLVPNAMGGGSSMRSMEEIQEKLPNTLHVLQTQRFEQDPNQLLQQSTPYWGDQPFTSGPVYAGAVVCLLFVFSLFFVKGPLRIWAIIAFVFSIILALGRNFPLINNFMFDYFPFYNKFRTPSMSLSITTFVMVFFGAFGLKELVSKKIKKEQILKYLYISTGIVGGICLLLAVVPTIFLDFTTGKENLPAELLSALQSDRESLCKADAWRSLVFILLAATSIWLLIKEKLKPMYVVIAIAAISLIDLWIIDKRYLNDSNFVDKKKAVSNQYAMMPVDASIKTDPSLGYRVLNLAANPFNDSRTSYHHRSIGGYHPAKLRRYQEMVDSLMSDEINYFANNINKVQDDSSRIDLLKNLTTLNMLNAKYFIFDYSSAPFVNDQTLGNAWFVDDVCLVNNANEELDSLRVSDVSVTAVINKEFEPMLSNWDKSSSSDSKIELIEQTSNTCVYKTSASKDELVVFSEIYYPKFWQIDIDGIPAEMLRANYVLRAMVVPKGEHTITFKFIPTTWMNVRIMTLFVSILIILLLGFLGYKSYKEKYQTSKAVK